MTRGAILERRIASTEAPRVEKFGTRYIVQTKGRWGGKALEWELWQREWLRELFLKYNTGERVYRQALLGIARKNGKSTLSAALALYGLVGTNERGPEVYAAASTKDQARIVFDQAREFVQSSPGLQDFLIVQRDRIICRSNNGVFRVLSADGPSQHGLNPSLVVIDELWAHKDPELYYALTTAQGARDNPLVINITTAGFDRETVCYDLYRRGQELRDKGPAAMRKAKLFFKWFEAAPDAAVDDRSGWMAANPSEWITLDNLEHEYETLPESVFRRLHLNQWTESEDAWIKPYQWDKLEGRPADLRDMEWVVMGIDVGIRRDSAAVVYCGWKNGILQVRQEIWVPEEEAEGFGVSDIRAMVMSRAAELGNVREIAYDPFSFRESAEIMADAGLPVEEFPQNASRMGPASEGLFELVVENRLVHDDDKRMRDQVLSAVTQPTERGGWRISKRKSLERIDGAVALAMAALRAMELQFEPWRQAVLLGNYGVTPKRPLIPDPPADAFMVLVSEKKRMSWQELYTEHPWADRWMRANNVEPQEIANAGTDDAG